MSPNQTLPSIDIGVPGVKLAPGDHVCAFYPSLAERDEILMPFLTAGLRDGEKCIAILDADDLSDIEERVHSESGVNPKSVGQLDLHCCRDTYLANGVFNTEAMLDFWGTSVSEAVANGYSFARVAGEMTWALSNLPGVEELVQYEAELNRFLPRYPQVILCLYELDRFGGEVLVDVLKTHPKVLLGGMVLDNPYYLEPEEFLASRDWS